MLPWIFFYHIISFLKQINFVVGIAKIFWVSLRMISFVKNIYCFSTIEATTTISLQSSSHHNKNNKMVPHLKGARNLFLKKTQGKYQQSHCKSHCAGMNKDDSFLPMEHHRSIILTLPSGQASQRHASKGPTTIFLLAGGQVAVFHLHKRSDTHPVGFSLV